MKSTTAANCLLECWINGTQVLTGFVPPSPNLTGGNSYWKGATMYCDPSIPPLTVYQTNHRVGTALADVKLAVTEACTNCVVHAYPNGSGENAVFEVEADPGEDELLVIVRDYGRGISPNTESPGLGLGLPLIAAPE